MLELLRELVEIESPTGSPGVRAVSERLAEELGELGANTRFADDNLIADLPGEGRPLLLIGHSDTVWEHGTLEKMPFHVQDGRAYGPGTHDMKAGLVVLLGALRVTRTERALRVFVTADEEVGSPSARPLLEALAPEVAAALVLEPPTPQGHLKTGRKGIGRFRLTVYGRAGHASGGRGGDSAIEELAHQIVRIHAIEDWSRGITVNVGVIRGGTRENVVAAHAEALLDVRVAHMDDTHEIEDVLRNLDPVQSGTSLELSGGWTRPPLEPSAGSAALFRSARAYGLELGLDLEETTVPGGSDGNLIGALGVPVLDGLGAEGSGAHALDEHVVVDSMPVRAALLARLLEEPGLENA
jgi:glutamate carboxypeptidase